MVRSDVICDNEDKKVILNMLFYFLENTIFRSDYEVNTFTGLPQEEIDCSRILAYYFLNPHDKRMKKFCRNNDAHFYRWVDDMYFAVDDDVTGKKALKNMTESLRKLNLVASIEKTAIYPREEAHFQLFFEENDFLDKYEEKIIEKIKNGQSIEKDIAEIKKKYSELITSDKKEFRNWNKILKRFYTICSYSKSSLLFSEFLDHIVKHPIIFANFRISKYLIRIQNENGFKDYLSKMIYYLYSPENLYQVVESNLLESFLYIDMKKLSNNLKNKLKNLCNDIFFKKNEYKPLSDYARAIACLLFYRYNNEKIEELANHYISYSEKDNLLKKYIIFVSLTTKNDPLRRKILDKAKTEQNQSINRLLNFIENINYYKTKKVVKDFFKINEVLECTPKTGHIRLEY